MAQFIVSADSREKRGKNAARQLRRSGKIPAVLYGNNESPIAVSVSPKELSSILNSSSGHNTIFTLGFQDAKTSVMLKDWQFDPIKGHLLHADLVRIALDKVLQVNVPVNAVGEAKGVKLEGGIFEFVLRTVEVECLPSDIPENISIDISELSIGSNLRVSDLKVDPKIKILSDSELVVAHVIAPKEEKVAEPAAEAVVAEPEVIKKGKVASEEEGEPAKGEEKKEKEKK
ncbi:MAG: 50S ribosomal protein L25/general stress protein Ctc [Acidimicrobiia bacterium]|nr:50S ribosomal protein L25/general stress protein Ctc [Acidimicrobiia bacterium]